MSVLQNVLFSHRCTSTHHKLVLDALRHLEYVCGQPIKRATMQFRRCLSWEDESARNEVVRQCLIEIGGWIDRNKRYSGE